MLVGNRRAGAVNLTLDLVDVDQQLIYPPDKNSDASRGTRRDHGAMPVPRPLAEGLVDFARSRGVTRPDDRVFSAPTVRPCPPAGTTPSSATAASSTSSPRGTASDPTICARPPRRRSRRVATDGRGPALKRRFLRHKPNGQTDVYGQASFAELAAAVARWTGSPHPLAY